MVIVAIALLVATTIVGCCPGASVVRVPVVVRPPPCLDELPPRAPAVGVDDDAVWARYYRALDVWAMLVVDECGKHLLAAPDAEETAGSYGERVR